MTADGSAPGQNPKGPVTNPLPPAEREALAAKVSQLPAMQRMGARADFSDPDAIRILVDDLQTYHRGGLGTEAVNGAVIAGLCDAAIGFVGYLHTLGRRAGTAQLNIHFIRPVHGPSVTAVGRLVRAGSHLVFATADVVDETGKICARCDGIVAVSTGRSAEVAI